MPPAPPGNKRSDRRHLRLAIDVPGELRGRASWPVEVVDLSIGGCLVRGGVQLKAGAILDLRFALGPSAFAAKVRVKEVFVDGESASSAPAPYLLGLEFLRLSAGDQHRLRQFLETETRRRRSAPATPA